MENSWKLLKLEDLVDSISNTFKKDKKEVIFLNTSDVLEGKVINKRWFKIDELPGQAKKKIMKNDILYSEIRPKNKRYAFINFDAEEYVVSTKLMVLRSRENILPKFLYYYLTSNNILDILQDRAESRSGTFPQITFSEVKRLEIKLPPINIQKKICNFIKYIDKKIELNNEMNKTLEEMAQAVFKSWFIDFEPFKDGEFEESELGMIPKRWKVRKVSDICDVSSSKRIFMADYKETGIPFYRGKEIIEKSKGNEVSTEIYIDIDKFTEIKSKFGSPTKGDILLTSVGTIGIPYLVKEEEFYFKDGNLTWFKNFKVNGYNLYIYYWIKYGEGKNNIDKITIGSTQKALTISSLKDMKIVIPSNQDINKFSRYVSTIVNRYEANINETLYLKSIRDTLLPKLISGEIKLND